MAPLGTYALQFLPYAPRLDSCLCHLELIVWSCSVALSWLGRSHYRWPFCWILSESLNETTRLEWNTFTPLEAFALWRPQIERDQHRFRS